VIHARMKGIPGEVTLYEIKGIGGSYHLHLKERQEALAALPRRQPVLLDRIREKIVVSTLDQAFLTHLSETSAQVLYLGELAEWEDVRLHLTGDDGQVLPGRIYAKATTLEPGPEGLSLAHLRFTSVSPEARRAIRQALGRE